MKAKESVEVDYRSFRNVNGQARGVVRSLAVRHDDVQPVRRAALEEDNQALRPRARIGGAVGGSRQKTRQRCRADRGEGAVAKENSAGNGHIKISAAGFGLRANTNGCSKLVGRSPQLSPLKLRRS